MRPVLLPSLASLGALALTLLAGAPLAHADPPHESVVTAAPDALVSVRVVDCNVHVVGSARRDVKVSTDSDALTVSSDGGHVTISVRPGSGSSIDVAVPSTVHLEVRGVGASASVRDVSGPVVVGTVGGDIDVQGPAHDVEVGSISGRVQVTLGRADVRASSVSGDVAVRLSGGGTASVKAVSGELHFSAGAPITRLETRTVSGDVQLELRLAGSGPFETHTHSGDVHVTLPKNPPVTVDAHTYHGEVEDPDAPTVPPGTSRPVLAVWTFSGDVRVDRK